MHRTRRTYLRPAEHPGPETVLLDGLVRVKRGQSVALHTSDDQHAQLLAEGWEEVPLAAAPVLTEEEVAAALARGGDDHADQLLELGRAVHNQRAAEAEAPGGQALGGGFSTKDNPRFDAIPRRVKKGEVSNG